MIDAEEDGEVFQVKKSSHSKKVMKMLDKERRRKKHREHESASSIGTTSSAIAVGHETGASSATSDGGWPKTNNGFNNNKTNACDVVRATSYDDATSKLLDDGTDDLTKQKRFKSSQISNSSIAITDDLVVRLLFINFI